MLSSIQENILSDWLNLLEDFCQLISQSPIDVGKVKSDWSQIESYVRSQIISFDISSLPLSHQSSWQTWQTETNRYVRLLNTELIFWYSAKKNQTQNDRFKNINNRLQQMISLTKIAQSIDK